MNYKFGNIALCIVIAGSIYGCATVFKGYEDKVLIIGIPLETKIYTEDNIEAPLLTTSTTKKTFNKLLGVIDTVLIVEQFIYLRSNTDHLLTFKYLQEEKRIHLYPRLSAGWVFLDVITGTFFVDYYTGNWNHFTNIDYKSVK